jgi:hypothetical protein
MLALHGPRRGTLLDAWNPHGGRRLAARHVEPGGRRTEIALQRDWNDRRAPSTLAAGDEVPMNSRERRVQ